MTDQTTKQPLSVSANGTTVPYVMVPVTQLDGLRKPLDSHQIPYWGDEIVISLNGELAPIAS